MQYSFEIFQNCFKPDLQNHIVKNIFDDKFVTISNKANLSLISNLFFVICSEINVVSNTNLILL